MVKGRNGRGYTSIIPVRRALASLEEYYGGLMEVSGATGIPYRTLQGIMLRGKYQRVTKPIADRIKDALSNPPEYTKPRKCSACGRGLGRIRGPHCSAKCKERVRQAAWNKRFIPLERVKPLVEFMVDLYGTTAKAAEASGIPASTLGNVKQDGKMRGVSRETAAKIVEFVLSHKRLGQSLFSDAYENGRPARFITSYDKLPRKLPEKTFSE